MVLARIVGSAIVPGRLARDVDPTVVAAVLRARHRLAQTTTPWPSFVPDGRTLAEMRSRLLEDPCHGLGWCTEGLARGAALGLIDLDDAALAIAALRAWPILERSHGDLLPRNVIVDGASARLVDLECAGDHPEAWDHALLWANLCPAVRRVVETDFGLDDGPRGQAFRACVVFALVRELKFARGARFAGELQKTLHDAVSALRSRGPLGD
jgi:Ser/Thr protein kinase RdoA (MazF antagonist)